MSDNKSPKKRNFNFYWIYAIIGVVLIGLQFIDMGSSTEESSFDEFKEFAALGHVEKLEVVNEENARVYIKKDFLDDEEHKEIDPKNTEGPHYTFKIPPAEHFYDQIDKLQAELKEAHPKDYDKNYKFPVKPITQENWGRDILSYLLPFVILIAIWIFIMRRISGGGGGGSQIFNIGKSRAQVFDKGKGTNVSFKDVAGLEGAKEEIEEIVAFLKNPKKYTELGAKIPKGALLVGPPGTGKTLLAKAVAGEAKVPFFSLSGSDFVEMFVGVGASRVRDLFKQAKEKAPCIIFIDEIDAIGRARGKSPNMGSNDERENTLNQLLTEMDGFGTNSGVIILAATNRADILDRALMRAGRFDRQIYVDMPDVNERKEIFEVHLKPLKLSGDIDRDFLARQTPGFSGADIANICNEAALIAARKSKKAVEKQDFLDAVDRIIGGLEKKNKIITAEEKRAIAFHEAGHATCSWLLEHASPLVKVTIVPRGQSLGAAWYLPEERQITRTAQMLDEMCALLGGRAAEEVTFKQISTGALSDLERVTKMAQAMVTVYGLNDKLGNISYYDSSGQREYAFDKPYSEDTAKTIDEEISKLIESQYTRAKKLLSDNYDKLEKLANKLLEKEVIFKEDLEEIFGKRPFEKDANPLEKADRAESTMETPIVPAVELGGLAAPKDEKKDTEGTPESNSTDKPSAGDSNSGEAPDDKA